MGDTRSRDPTDRPGSTTITPPGSAPDRRRPSSGVVAAVCLTFGTFLTGALFLQFFATSFSLVVPAGPPTRGEIVGWEVTAVACLALLVAGTVAAHLGDRLYRVFLALPLLALGVLMVFLLPVPGDRWEREAPVTDSTTRGPVCRSRGDSDDCPGG
ncbi:MAG: hypothetical protein IR158_12830 [Cellulomonas sp.]|uniref:hypothetical protein n=1 Tax=Cellulomonas sp. TaxID=40001 RepID=UPI0019FCE670|nr:hypothetical protein [Cellulomonas sp.]MBF0688633.1 hypothetical protein [Cellulomonas sp.]